VPQIKLSATIAAPPERVFPLVSTARGLSQWWAEDVTEHDGVADLGFFKRNTVYRLRLEKSAAPTDAEWHCLSGHEWEGARLLFSLTPLKDKTRIVFTQAHWRAETDCFFNCTTTWGVLMFRLKATAEGKSSGPLFTQDSQSY
jgi:uncharacterized protein YndB with AHSA1/START domain